MPHSPFLLEGNKSKGRKVILKNKHMLPFFWMLACVTQRKTSETNITQKTSASPAGLWLPCMMTGLWQATFTTYLINRKQSMAAWADILHSSYVRQVRAGIQWRKLSHKNLTTQIYCTCDKMFRWWWWVGRLRSAENSVNFSTMFIKIHLFLSDRERWAVQETAASQDRFHKLCLWEEKGEKVEE